MEKKILVMADAIEFRKIILRAVWMTEAQFNGFFLMFPSIVLIEVTIMTFSPQVWSCWRKPLRRLVTLAGLRSAWTWLPQSSARRDSSTISTSRTRTPTQLTGLVGPLIILLSLWHFHYRLPCLCSLVWKQKNIVTDLLYFMAKDEYMP